MAERMRIATWNLDHAPSKKHDAQIHKILSINPDILILTETCEALDLAPHGFTRFSSKPNNKGLICSSIHIGKRVGSAEQLRTYDETTAVAIQAGTPIGEMIIYGTIITYHGDKGLDGDSPAWKEHYQAIEDHGRDWMKLIAGKGGNMPLIAAGDFNQTRDGSTGTYGTKHGRELLGEELRRNHMKCLTTENFGETGKLTIDPSKGFVRHNIDHICMTENAFVVVSVGAWDHFLENGEILSDHNGVFVDLVSQ